MKHLSLTSVKDIYFVLSQNTTTPNTQGATQKISAMRHLFAFYRYCVKNKVSECDLKIKAHRDEFVDYVSEIVKLDGDNYTANFYSSIVELEDCRVASNFYSAGVVTKSRINKTAIFPYPTKHSLLNVQNEVLVQKENASSEINEYLTSEKIRLAFAFWLVRKDVIDEANIIDDVHNKISEKYSDELADSIIPNNDASKKCFTNDFQLKFTDNYEELSKEVILSTIAELERTNQNKVEMPYQQIFYGAPGTGKSFGIDQITGDEDIIRITFHPDTDYSTFVGAYKPTMVERAVMTTIGTKRVQVEDQKGEPVIESQIEYRYIPQAFLKAYIRAWRNYEKNPENPQKQFLIIEEINRGNCAQIFGDIFQLLDRNADGLSTYDIEPDKDIQKYISDCKLNIKEIYNNAQTEDISDKLNRGEILCLPSNLYIWATMNTSDQSLFPIDSAFKRRWEWKYIPINTRKENWNILVNGKAYSWSSFLENINEQIGETTNSEDKKLGFYFCKATDNTIDADRFVSKVLFYIYNDVFKDYGFDKAFFKDNTKVMTFQSYYNEDGSINEEQVSIFLDNLQVEDVKSAPEGLEDDEPQESAAEISKTQQARKDFWQAFLTYANANNTEYRECFSGRKTASTDKWYNFFIGQKKCHLCVEQTRSKKELMIGLYGEQSKEDYFKLLPYRQEIEQELGFSLDWREMPTKQSSYIVEVTPNIDFDDASKRNEIFDFIIDRLLRMRTTFLKYLAK